MISGVVVSSGAIGQVSYVASAFGSVWCGVVEVEEVCNLSCVVCGLFMCGGERLLWRESLGSLVCVRVVRWTFVRNGA